jgi:serine phosphatase RsbU (regulator of sigma subunit)/serine/threonine protein kinase
MASLLILKGANQGQKLQIQGDRVVLGRNPDCDVVISGTAVSREHAQILAIQGKYYIEDKQSRNGTFVNNQQINGRTLLKDNDRIKICDFLATFQDSTPARPPLPSHLSRATDEPESAAGSWLSVEHVEVSSQQPLVAAGGLSVPDYLAPEQIDERPDRPVSAATDLHAVGVILFQMLTGDLPFPAGVDGFEKLQVIAKRRFTSAVARCRELGIESRLAPLIDDCLAGRYRRADHLLLDIRNALGRTPEPPDRDATAVSSNPPPLPGESFLILRILFEDTVSEAYEATGMTSGARVTLRLLKPSFHSPRYAELVRNLVPSQAPQRTGIPPVLLRRFWAGRGSPLPVLPGARLNLNPDLGSDGCLCLVEEYIGSRTLLGAIAAGEFAGAEPRIAGVAEQILTGLAYVHARDSFHANLTPYCIFLGDRDCVKIEGFGLHARVEQLRMEEGGDSLGGSTIQPMLEERAPEQLKLLLEVTTRLLGQNQEPAEIAGRVVDVLFQLFKQADRGFVIFREEGTNKLIPRVVKSRRPDADANARFSKSIVKRCLENLEAYLIDDAATDNRFALSQSVADFRIRSVMCAPLCSADGKAFGVIQVDTQDRSKKFTRSDLGFLVSVANQAAVALENARLMQEHIARERLKRELELARQVQRGFLPAQLPEVAGYEFCAHYEPVQEVGGDWYDFVPLGDRLAVLIGDVAGKGVAAALLSAKATADAQFCLLTEPVLARAVTRLNARLLQAGLSDRFVVLVAGVLDPARHRLTLVNAGGCIPVLRRAATGRAEWAGPEMTGLPLGVLDEPGYVSYDIELFPGDSIFFWTDVLANLPRPGGEVLGTEGVVKLVESAPPSAGALVQEVRRSIDTARLPDDLTLLCVHRRAAGGA